MFIAYMPKKLSAARMQMVDRANEIIATYAAEGYDLTLRQLYYQFVARDLIANRQSEYKRLGDIISDARRAGLISWTAIVDRTRNLHSLAVWDSPSAIMDAVARQFRYDRWERQPNYVEVWFEKDALMGVFERVANEHRVPFFSCRGYTSDSEVWGAAQRLSAKADEGKAPVILHFGDHDPSGLDMTRDIEDRLRLFGAWDFEVRRLALNMDQVIQYDPPPNPAKQTDSRFVAYEAEHGGSSWELDALEPTVLGALVRDEVENLIDPDVWEEDAERERAERARLSAIARHWPRVESFIGREGLV